MTEVLKKLDPHSVLTREALVLEEAAIYYVEEVEQQSRRIAELEREVERLKANYAGYRAQTRAERRERINQAEEDADKISDLTAQIAQRDKALAEAPHGHDCLSWQRICGGSCHLCPRKPCDCWKSDMLAALAQVQGGPIQSDGTG